MDNNQQNDNRPNGPGGAGQGPNRNRSAFMVFLAITVAVLLGMALFNGLMGSSGSEEISYDKFLEWLDNGYIKSVTVNGSNLEVELKGDALRSAIGQRTVTYYTGNMNDPLLVQRLEKAGVTYKREVSSGITDAFTERRSDLCTADGFTLDRIWPADAQDGRRRRRHYGCRQEQSQGLCAKRDRYYV